MFKKINQKKLLRIVKNKLYIGDTLIPEGDAKEIVAEAKDIKKMMIYELLNDNIRDSIQKEMYRRWKDRDSGLMGRAMLDTVQSYEQMITMLSNMKIDYKD